MEYRLIDKLMPQEGENPDDLQRKIDSLLCRNNEIDENDLNEILAGIEYEGFRKGLSVGIKFCCELLNSDL